MRQVYIAGVGSTRFGRHPESSLVDLAVDAIEDAIKDARIDRDVVGALYFGNFVGGQLTGQEILAGLTADEVGLPCIPCTKVEGACASGGIAFRHAWLAVASRSCDIAIAVGSEKMSHVSTSQVTEALNCAMDVERDGASGLSFPGIFGLIYRMYESSYGDIRRKLSSVVVKNKRNGLTNPLAQMGASISVEEVEDSPMVADPLRLFDCCPISDGAAATVLTSRDHVVGRINRGTKDSPVEVVAAVQTRGVPFIAGHSDMCSFSATVEATQRVYDSTGIGPKDLDFVELHDCFSITEVLDSEDIGLVPRGEGAHWAAEGRTAVHGDIPINPSGGLLAKGHPVGATGLGQIYEAVQQLRGNHSNQVKDAEIGLTHNLGGTGVACTVSLLRRADA